MKLLKSAFRYCKACDIHITIEVSADTDATPDEAHAALVDVAERAADGKMREHWLAQHAHVLDTPEGRVEYLKACARLGIGSVVRASPENPEGGTP